MRFLVLLFALAMPVVAWFSQQEAFGPDNGTISDRYPTLLVAAGYAFSIWGLIFLLDVAFALWQMRGDRGATIARVRPPAAIGFALTAAWMPVFSQQWFVLALAIIWASLAALVYCAMHLARDPNHGRSQTLLAWLPLSLHAGWLSLAAFLNTAQVIVAQQWLDTGDMLVWSTMLYGIATLFLLSANHHMRGNVAYALAVLWGLIAVFVEQSSSTLAGADVAAWIAAGIALIVLVQTAWLRLRTVDAV